VTTVREAPPITVIDLLPADFPRRDLVEKAVRTAFDGLAGGPWVVTLQPPDAEGARVSVFVRTPKSVMLTSFASDASDEEITARLVRGTRIAGPPPQA
jgi:hypothetical protein